LWPLTRQPVPISALNDVKINYAYQKLKHKLKLKVLKVVGFDGSASVAKFAFCLTQNAPTLKKIICDTRCPQLFGTVHRLYDIEYIDRIAPARRQAELLSKLIPGGIDVVIL
ncbi:hypothetical protein SOVF_211020, partial [Spinacia oleracea]